MTSHSREIDDVKKKIFGGNLLRMGWTTCLPSFKFRNYDGGGGAGGTRPPAPR